MYQAIARIEDIPEGGGKVVQVGQRKILLLNIEGDFHALDSFCTHRGSPLIRGEVIEGQLLCPWYGNTFDVTTGTCPVAPKESVRIYPIASNTFTHSSSSPDNDGGIPLSHDVGFVA